MGARRELASATKARLDAIAGMSKYVSEAPKTPPTLGANDPRVAPYLVFHPGGGSPLLEESQCDDEPLGLEWTFQVTVASGDPNDLPTLIDAVTGQLQHWQPLDRAGCGRCKQISNFVVMKDEGETPPRFFIPLVFRVPLGT